MNYTYDYNLAFSRNLGFLNEKDQELIASKTIGIPGLGGVGGCHLHTLARLGFKKFHIADFDTFDVHNFNRQIGAKISTLGKTKVEVMHEMILDIIPEAEIKMFPEGVNDSNRSDFLEGLDYLVDGLDFFAIKERAILCETALKKGIYVLTAGPFGMGTNVLVFNPKGMSFNEYFNFKEGMSSEDMLAHFLAGANPRPIFLKYVFHKDKIDPSSGKVPSLYLGVSAATTGLVSELYKLVLNNGPVRFVPRSCQYDFYFQKIKHNWIPFGNKNLKQKIMIKILKKILT